MKELHADAKTRGQERVRDNLNSIVVMILVVEPSAEIADQRISDTRPKIAFSAILCPRVKGAAKYSPSRYRKEPHNMHGVPEAGQEAFRNWVV
jgi:hypothetical protein